jgi:hypothetical protein
MLVVTLYLAAKPGKFRRHQDGEELSANQRL